MLIARLMEAHARIAGQAVGQQRTLTLLDVIAEAADRHQHTSPMSVSEAYKLLRHALAHGYDPAQMIVELGPNPRERTDPTGITLPGDPSWLCWRSAADRENAESIRYIDRVMLHPLPTSDKPTP